MQTLGICIKINQQNLHANPKSAYRFRDSNYKHISLHKSKSTCLHVGHRFLNILHIITKYTG
jgi:hypothetical protein